MLDENIEKIIQLTLALTSQEWNYLGLGNDPLTQPTSDLNIIVERITCMILIRIIPIIYSNNKQNQQNQQNQNQQQHNNILTNIASSNICIQLLNESILWPHDILNDSVIDELRQYIYKIISGYKDVPYHSKEHAFHVILSINKLIDMMVTGKDEIIIPTMNNIGNNNDDCNNKPKRSYPSHITYGLRHDPIALFSLIFAALIHDVEHQGIPNRQLSTEDDRLAVLYNDQSIAENWSLYVGFSELLQDKYNNLRRILFQMDYNMNNNDNIQYNNNMIHNDNYRRFRKIVIDLVLSTDIASPERTQINKSKWKEAFGDPFETVERKIKAAQSMNDNTNNNNNNIKNVIIAGRRLSFTGRCITPRRASHLSTISAVSFHGNSHSGNDAYDSNNLYEYEGEEESLSGTPDVSDNEYDTGDRGNDRGSGDRGGSDRGSGEIRNDNNRNSVVVNVKADVLVLGAGLKRMERRLSAVSTSNTVNTTKYRQRLGILRTVDLSGETIETYSRSGSLVGNMSITVPPQPRIINRSSSSPPPTTNNNNFNSKSNIDDTTIPTLDGTTIQTTNKVGISNTNPATSYEADDPDELKATVVMETMITAADVAHNLQGWDHMVKWSDRLYLELRKAYIMKRSTADPSERWFENQIGFLESYLLPLARRLEDTGVFNDQSIGETIFSSTVEFNRDRWLTDGYDVTQKAIQHGTDEYPSVPSKDST